MDEIEMLKEKCRALEEALAAANNDAARAELRARDLHGRLADLCCMCDQMSEFTDPAGEPDCYAVLTLAQDAVRGAPDSDARLREVMGRAARRGYEAASRPSLPDFDAIIDELLRVKP